MSGSEVDSDPFQLILPLGRCQVSGGMKASCRRPHYHLIDCYQSHSLFPVSCQCLSLKRAESLCRTSMGA